MTYEQRLSLKCLWSRTLTYKQHVQGPVILDLHIKQHLAYDSSSLAPAGYESTDGRGRSSRFRVGVQTPHTMSACRPSRTHDARAERTVGAGRTSGPSRTCRVDLKNKTCFIASWGILFRDHRKDSLLLIPYRETIAEVWLAAGCWLMVLWLGDKESNLRKITLKKLGRSHLTTHS